jgi:hypothetical protein
MVRAIPLDLQFVFCRAALARDQHGGGRKAVALFPLAQKTGVEPTLGVGFLCLGLKERKGDAQVCKTGHHLLLADPASGLSFLWAGEITSTRSHRCIRTLLSQIRTTFGIILHSFPRFGNTLERPVDHGGNRSANSTAKRFRAGFQSW